MKNFILIAAIAVTSVSCTQLANIAQQIPAVTSTSNTITNSDNIAGLKNSLSVGIGNAVGLLGKENGFFNDSQLKINMPTEAQTIIDNIKLVPGGQDLVDKAVLSLNRSAEDAVNEATPIFKNAITSMSITDATGILFGAQNAATEYLRKTTYDQLKAAFAPKVKASLDKPLVAGISTTTAWSNLTSGYNKVAGSVAGKIAGLNTVNVDIENYVTEKALDALFVKIAAEEKSIRTDPTARVNDILKKVFGQLDK